MWENATNSCRMMEAIVQIGSAGMSAPLGSVPLGKKSRADGLLHNSAVVTRRTVQALPRSGLTSLGRSIEDMPRANVFSLSWWAANSAN